MQDDNRKSDMPRQDNNTREDQSKPFSTQEKSSLGGDFNSGVTSQDPAERDEIEKKGSLANIDQSNIKEQ